MAMTGALHRHKAVVAGMCYAALKQGGLASKPDTGEHVVHLDDSTLFAHRRRNRTLRGT